VGIYLKYQGVTGDATQEGYTGYMNVTHFSWDLTRPFFKTTGGTFNREPQQARVGKIVCLKNVDHASGDLMKIAATATKGLDCEIAFVATGDPSEEYMKFTLKDALLQSLELQATSEGNARPVERLVIDFTELEIEVKPLEETNAAGGVIRTKYNIATGKAS
jgi:type VI secretion system secreted protein Hcp